MIDEDNIEQGSYLMGFDAGERSAVLKLKWFSYLLGILTMLLLHRLTL